MNLISVDPFTGERIGEYACHSDKEVNQIIEKSAEVQKRWSRKVLKQRTEQITALAGALRVRSLEFAELMAREMGKPVDQGVAEVEKCAWVCEYYAQHAEEILKDRVIETDARLSGVRHDPLGVWLAIMPWNFPFWQVFRCAVPAMIAGNTVILKHASNVTGCALAIEELVRDTIGKKLLSVLILSGDRMPEVIGHPLIRGVSFTGSESAGSRVAAMAGAHIKPTVLELGGSNAFVVWEDADLEWAAADAVLSRFQNTGQSCISAKRFIIHHSVYQAFLDIFTQKMAVWKPKNPLKGGTLMGPLAKREFSEILLEQVNRSIREGAVLHCGGHLRDNLWNPTVLTDCKPHMVCMQEELFGPVAACTVVETWEEAIEVSNSTRFGLGVSIYTSRPEVISSSFDRWNEGGVFVNSIVKSDPRLPFGGIKNSGFGRELSNEGILHFTNIKTFFIK